jgi:diaminopimelate decarboxylase
LLGGIEAQSLARTYGTPLLLIDLDAVDGAINALAACARGLDLEISYAAKAFATIEFFRHLAQHPIGLDVCSMGELVTAERAAIGPERLTLHGAGKSDDELRAARDGRVGAIVVDGVEELERLARLARDRCDAGVILRLNVGIEAQTHAFVRTGGNDTKFGIHPRDEAAALRVLGDNLQLRFDGLHAHVGSQIFEPQVYLDNTSMLLGAVERFARAGFVAPRVVIGGGFGVRSDGDSEDRLEVPGTIAAAHALIKKRAETTPFPMPRLGIEPGRAIVAAAGTTLYRVLAVKRQSSRTFVIVDGGIAENPRPALYGARHRVVPVAGTADDEIEMTLCGRSCENDELGTVSLPRMLRSGDLLAMCATGAYTYSMAGNYNRFPRPAVVGVSSGSARLLARRENLDDVLARDEQLSVTPDESGERAAAF